MAIVLYSPMEPYEQIPNIQSSDISDAQIQNIINNSESNNNDSIISILQNQDATNPVDVYESLNSDLKINENNNEALITDFSNNTDYSDQLKLFNDMQGEGIESKIHGNSSVDSIVQAETISLDNHLSTASTELIQAGLTSNVVDQSISVTKVENYLDKPIIDLIDGTLNSCENNTDLYNSLSSQMPNVLNMSDSNNLISNEINQLQYENNSTYENKNSMPNITNTITPNESHALELALASEEERQSPWIDINSLTNELSDKIIASTAIPTVRTECTWSESNALPTAVHSLVNLLGPEPYPLEIKDQHLKAPVLETVNLVAAENVTDGNAEIVMNYANEYQSECCLKNKPKKTETTRNILQEITADAGICKCSNCVCKDDDNCTNCSHESNEKKEQHKSNSSKSINLSEIVSNLQNKCCCNNQNSCGSCCVVICIKTLQELQEVFNSCCKSTSSAGCCKGNSTNHQGISLPISSLKSQLAGNQ